jgi:hypothetical protein
LRYGFLDGREEGLKRAGRFRALWRPLAPVP